MKAATSAASSADETPAATKREKRKKDLNSTTISAQGKPPLKRQRKTHAEVLKDKLQCKIRADDKSALLDQHDFD